MDQVDAYTILAREIEQYRRLGYHDLAEFAERPAIETPVRVGPHELTLWIRVRRLSRPPGALRIDGTVFGPRQNWWRSERLDESIIVQQPQ